MPIDNFFVIKVSARDDDKVWNLFGLKMKYFNEISVKYFKANKSYKLLCNKTGFFAFYFGHFKGQSKPEKVYITRKNREN